MKQFRYELFQETLREFREELKESCLWRQGNRVDSLIKGLEIATSGPRSRSSRERAEIVWYYVEGVQWNLAYQAIRGSVALYADPLKLALGGSAFLFDENPANSIARDTLFELATLGILRRYGLPAKLSGGGGPDIELPLPPFERLKEAAIECKRPKRPESVKSLARKAKKQLTKWCDDQSDTRTGILALDLTTPFYHHVTREVEGQVGEKVPTVSNLRDLEVFLQKEMELFEESFGPAMAEIRKSPHVVGHIAYYAIPYAIKGQPSPQIGQHLRVQTYHGHLDANALSAWRFVAGELKEKGDTKAPITLSDDTSWTNKNGLYIPSTPVRSHRLGTAPSPH